MVLPKNFVFTYQALFEVSQRFSPSSPYQWEISHFVPPNALNAKMYSTSILGNDQHIDTADQ